jgi:hypothetical protein
MKRLTKNCDCTKYKYCVCAGFRCHEIYGMVLEDDTKKAYPFNRNYKDIGNVDTAWVDWPEEAKSRNWVWLYNDGSQPWAKKSYMNQYMKKLEDYKKEYEIVYWKADSRK